MLKIIENDPWLTPYSGAIEGYVQKRAPVSMPKSDLLQPSPSIITAPAFERFSLVQYRKQYSTENSIKYRHA